MALDNPFDFTGKTVLLAGATGGLGHPVTLAFARAGANIAGCARNREALDKLAAELKGSSGGILMDKVDLCDEKQVVGFVDNTRKRFGRIDVLVTLVGNIIRKPSVDYSLDEWPISGAGNDRAEKRTHYQLCIECRFARHSRLSGV